MTKYKKLIFEVKHWESQLSADRQAVEYSKEKLAEARKALREYEEKQREK